MKQLILMKTKLKNAVVVSSILFGNFVNQAISSASGYPPGGK